jgi:DNA adenine methylase
MAKRIYQVGDRLSFPNSESEFDFVIIDINPKLKNPYKLRRGDSEIRKNLDGLNKLIKDNDLVFKPSKSKKQAKATQSSENFLNEDRSSGREYAFKSPNGEIFTSKGVYAFAKNQGLSDTGFYQLVSGKWRSYKGWTVPSEEELSAKFCKRLEHSENPLTAFDKGDRLITPIETPLKWAGKKDWLVPIVAAVWDKYRHLPWYDLFLGSAALPLALQPQKVVACDANPHLINFWVWVRENGKIAQELINDESFYYQKRDEYNSGSLSNDSMAELFYYFNKAGWRGLCRFNSSGGFNSPYGHYKDPTFQTDFSEIKEVIASWEFQAIDFDHVELPNDAFVFADPPYHGNFTNYWGTFTWDDQVALAKKLADHQGPVIATNSATREIISLYSELGFELLYQQVARTISSDGDRAPALEVICLKNFPPEDVEIIKSLTNGQKPELGDAWNPEDFGKDEYLSEPDGQITIFVDTSNEPFDPSDILEIGDPIEGFSPDCRFHGHLGEVIEKDGGDRYKVKFNNTEINDFYKSQWFLQGQLIRCELNIGDSVQILEGKHKGCLATIGKIELSSGASIMLGCTVHTQQSGDCFLWFQYGDIDTSCSQLDISSVVAAGTPKEQSTPDTDPSGELKKTPLPVQSGESDSQMLCATKQTLPNSQTILSSPSPSPMSSFGEVLAQTFPWLANEPGLMDLADNCFLKESDFLGFKPHLHSSLKTLRESLAAMEQLPSPLSSKRLQGWGMWGLGRSATPTDTSPKTGNEFSVWAITSDVKITQPKPTKKSLAEVFGNGNSVVYRSASGDKVYPANLGNDAPTLRSLSSTDGHQGGAGAYKIREGEMERPINPTEAEMLMGWQVNSTAIGVDGEGREFLLSNTQRIKMLGNGIVPGEIADLLEGLKPILKRKLESEIPQNLKVPYWQMRRKGITHQEARQVLNLG